MACRGPLIIYVSGGGGGAVVILIHHPNFEFDLDDRLISVQGCWCVGYGWGAKIVLISVDTSRKR